MEEGANDCDIECEKELRRLRDVAADIEKHMQAEWETLNTLLRRMVALAEWLAPEPDSKVDIGPCRCGGRCGGHMQEQPPKAEDR
jgi:hypothetical protein